MILTNSTAAEVGTSDVKAILSSTSLFRQFMCYMAITLSQAISGATGIIKNGIGGLTFDGNCTYTGPTQINGGQIVIRGGTSTLNGVISGTGVLTKTGATTLTLGASNTYSGGTIWNEGTITYNSSNAFGTGTFVSANGGTLQSGGAVTLPNDFALNAGTTQFRTLGANTITISGNISGAGNLTKPGNGFLNLYGTLTYTGVTNIQAGFIRAKKTVGASTATAQFQSGGLSLSVSFDVAPPSGTTAFRFFQGTTTQTYASITLSGVPAGTTATYTSATSTLSVTVP